MTIVQSMEILTAFDLASLSLLSHGVSPVMPNLHPLALCPSFWLFKIFFSLLSWSVRWFIHLRSDRSRLVSLNPLRLARHWLYYLFISFNKCLFQVTRMHIVLHFLEVLNNSKDPMFARKSCQIPNPIAACFPNQVNHVSHDHYQPHT